MARELIEPAAAKPRLAMTYEAWLEWAGEQERKTEWVDGEVIVFMPTTVRHADVVGFLYTLLLHYARFLNLGRVLAESVEMRLAGAARVPDVLFVAREHLDRLTDKRLLGPADLVVEVVSEDSVARDREEKFREYAAAGVPEYWLIDARPGEQRADFYQRTEEGVYRPMPLDADGRYQSKVVPGFWLRPEWLWQEPLPNAWLLVATIDPAARAALDALDAGGQDDDG